MSLKDSWARLDDLIEHVHTLNDSIAEVEDTDSARLADLAQLYRDGERGRDWQVLQGRIDRDDVTLEQILQGDDPSPEAQRVAQVSRANLAKVDATIEAAAESDPEALDPRAEAEELRITIERRAAALRLTLGLR